MSPHHFRGKEAAPPLPYPLYQVCSMLSRASKSTTYEASGLRDGNETLPFHSAGTWPTAMDLKGGEGLVNACVCVGGEEWTRAEGPRNTPSHRPLALTSCTTPPHLNTASSSEDMTCSPCTALSRLTRLSRMTDSSRLYRSISWQSTWLRDCSYLHTWGTRAT